MKKTGIVLEKRKDKLILLANGGEFCDAPIHRYPNAQVGDEVTLIKSINKKLYLVSLVASLILFVGITQLFGTANQVYGYVTLDVNPSMELAIDRNDNILDIKPFNPEAEELISQWNIKGLKFSAAIEQVFESLNAGGYLTRDTDIIISTVSVKQDTSSDFEEEVHKAISKAMEINNIDARTHVIAAKAEDRDTGNAQGLSTGKQVINTVIQTRGLEIDQESIKTNGLGRAMREKGIEVEEIVKEAKARSNSSDQTNNRNNGSGNNDRKTNNSNTNSSNTNSSNTDNQNDIPNIGNGKNNINNGNNRSIDNNRINNNSNNNGVDNRDNGNNQNNRPGNGNNNGNNNNNGNSNNNGNNDNRGRGR